MLVDLREEMQRRMSLTERGRGEEALLPVTMPCPPPPETERANSKGGVVRGELEGGGGIGAKDGGVVAAQAS